MMARLGTKLLVYVVSGLIIEGIIFGLTNKANDKTLLGKPMREKKKTKQSLWTGNVILGTDDYVIEGA